MRGAYGRRVKRHWPVRRGTLTLRAHVGDERLPFVTLARTVHLAVVDAIANAHKSSIRGPHKCQGKRSGKRGLTLGAVVVPAF